MRLRKEDLSEQAERTEPQEQGVCVSTAMNTIAEIEEDEAAIFEPNEAHQYKRGCSFSTHSWHLMTQTPLKNDQSKKKCTTESNTKSGDSSEIIVNISPYVMEGEKHYVWLPRQNTSDATVASSFEGHRIIENAENIEGNRSGAYPSTDLNKSSQLVASSHHLNRRRMTLLDRVNATQTVLKEMSEELAREEIEGVTRHMTLLDAAVQLQAKRHSNSATKSQKSDNRS